jgi:hypothetical protein
MKEPAFPLVAKDKTGMMINMGMSLRDYFAAKAMQALVTEIDDDGSYWMPEHVAELAYSQADEMLKAREA